MRDHNPSKLAMHSERKVVSTLLVSCLALPLLLSGLPGCSGEAGDSHIGDPATGAASGDVTRAGAPPVVFIPMDEGGMGNGTGGTGSGSGGAGPYMLPADYIKA